MTYGIDFADIVGIIEKYFRRISAGKDYFPIIADDEIVCGRPVNQIKIVGVKKLVKNDNTCGTVKSLLNHSIVT